MKKYLAKFKDIKNTNKKLYYVTIAILVMIIGVTFAYVIDQISGGAISRVFITADTADNLQFEVDKDISIKPTQFNFTHGGVDLSDTATATARLKANSTNNTASYTYNVYFQITTNEYIYTTADKKPEMILQVTNPNGENVTTLDGLTYNDVLQGFDITNLVDFITIAEDYEISSNSSTSFTNQNWIVTVKFINLDTNQIDNEGKTLEGKILIQGESQKYGDINIAVSNLPEAYGPLAELNCNSSNSIYDVKTNEIIVKDIRSNKNFCNLNYVDRTEKEYLNNKIISLSGTTQGIGEVVHETFNSGVFTNVTKLSELEYGTTLQYSAIYPWINNGTPITNAFSYSGTEWISNPENITSGTYYHLQFTLSAGSYYQICYEISPGNEGNALSLYEGGNIKFDVGASISSSKTGCVDLGFISSDINYRIVQYANTNIATVKFYIQKTNNALQVDAGYRYEGQDPNNYVWFNNELWRIIGVFDANSHGVTNTNLVKIIRNSSIGGLAWDKLHINDWGKSSLKALLNTEYLNSTNGTNGDNCYAGSAKTKCDYRTNGLKEYKNMIKEVTWYLGGTSGYSETAQEIYKKERDATSVYGSNPANTSAKVGLMYASDFGYAVPAESCARTTSSSSTNNNINCTLNNWLYNQGHEWMITHLTGNQNSVDMVSRGVVDNDSAYIGFAVRPTLYLESSVYVIDGDGSITNPYIIGM